MCGVVDKDVVFEVFGDRQTGAGEGFRDWLDKRRGSLAVGGDLLDELAANGKFREWYSRGIQSGLILQIGRDRVAPVQRRLEREGRCKSNDTHVLALAITSGARLLYTNDTDLMDDFRNRNIVLGPPGKIYTTKDRGDFRPAHKRLLRRKNLCHVPGHG